MTYLPTGPLSENDFIYDINNDQSNINSNNVLSLFSPMCSKYEYNSEDKMLINKTYIPTVTTNVIWSKKCKFIIDAVASYQKMCYNVTNIINQYNVTGTQSLDSTQIINFYVNARLSCDDIRLLNKSAFTMKFIQHVENTTQIINEVTSGIVETVQKSVDAITEDPTSLRGKKIMDAIKLEVSNTENIVNIMNSTLDSVEQYYYSRQKIDAFILAPMSCSTLLIANMQVINIASEQIVYNSYYSSIRRSKVDQYMLDLIEETNKDFDSMKLSDLSWLAWVIIFLVTAFCVYLLYLFINRNPVNRQYSHGGGTPNVVNVNATKIIYNEAPLPGETVGTIGQSYTPTSVYVP